MTAPTMKAERVLLATLSADTRALGNRPIAELILAAKTGSPATLRAVAARYSAAAAELAGTDHEDIAIILDVYAGIARRTAQLVEIGIQPMTLPRHLRLVDR